MKKTFTIEEIRYYLEGCVMHDGNGKEVNHLNLSLRSAIATLNEPEDGIRAVLASEKHRIEKKPLGRFVGVPCALIAGGSSGIIEKIDDKARRLLVNTGKHSFWVSTKNFFGKWYWGPNYNLQVKVKVSSKL